MNAFANYFAVFAVLGAALVWIGRRCMQQPKWWLGCAWASVGVGAIIGVNFLSNYGLEYRPSKEMIMLGLGAVVFLMMGVVLAVVAFVQHRDPQRHWTSILPLPVAAAGLALLTVNVRDRVDAFQAMDLYLSGLTNSPSSPLPEAAAPGGASPAPSRPSPVGDLLREWLGEKKPSLEKDRAAGPIVLEPQNFRITLPSDWTQIDASKINPEACFGARNFRARATVLIIAETLPEQEMPKAEELVEQQRVNFASLGTVENMVQKPMQLSGYPAVRMDFDLRHGISSERGIICVLTHRGYCWQVVIFGPKNSAKNLEAEADRLFKAFQIIDPQREGAPAPVGPEARHTSSGGWSVDLTGEREIAWGQPWPSLAKDFPVAEFGTMGDRSKRSLFVVQHWLPDLKVSDEDLADAMLVHFDFHVAQAISRQPCQQGPARGWEMQFRQTVDQSRYIQRVRVLRHGRRAWLISVTRVESEPEKAEATIRALDAVKIDEAAPTIPAKLPEHLRENFALLCHSVSLACAERSELEQAFQWSRHAWEAAPKQEEVMMNFIDCAERSNRLDEAIRLAEQSAVEDAQLKQMCRILLRLRTKEVTVACQEAETLLASGFRNDTLVDRYILALNNEHQEARALEVFDKYMGNQGLPVRRRLRGTLLFINGKKEEAFTTYRDALKTEPDPITALRLAQCLAEEERHEEAITAIKEFGGRGVLTIELWRAQAMSEFSLKRFGDAKISLESALKLGPGDERIKEDLRHVSAMLGQGNNSQIKTPLEPVVVAPALLKAPKGDHAAYLSGYNAHYLFRVRATELKKVDGRVKVRTTEYHRLRVDDAQAAEQFNTVRVGFQPRGESFYLNRLVVTDADGKEVGVGRVEDCYVLDDGDTGLATDQQTIHIPVPGLKPGCTVDYQYTREEEVAKDEPPFETYLFAQVYPVLRSAFVLKSPTGLIKAEASSSLTKTTEGEVTTWSIDRPIPLRMESRMAPLQTFLPMVSYGDPGAKWAAIGRGYLEQIKERLAAQAEVEATARRVAGSAKSDDDKVTALARYVREELSYKGIEFGRRARMPQTVSDIVRNRYGDCKDHSLLLVQLLRAVGIKADLALIHTGGILAPSLPSLDQFDHMIVYVPKQNRFLDCTHKAANMQQAPPGFGGFQALVLDEEKPALVVVPKSGESRISLQQEVEVMGDESVKVREVVEMDGVMAVGLRSILRESQPTHRRELLQQYLQSAGSMMEISALEVEQLDQCEAPLRIRMTTQVPKKTRLLGGRLLLEAPSWWEHIMLSVQAVEKRATPFRTEYAVRFESATKLKLPEGWRYTPGAPVQKKLEFADCSNRMQVTSAQVEIQRALSVRTGTFPASKFADLVKEYRECRAVLNSELLLEKVGAK